MPFTLAIIGRPNVGKSTLFNRLSGKRLALVHDRPGVTRDRREAEAVVGGGTIRIIDTAGLGDAEAGPEMARLMREQTEIALAEADAALFVIDARAGLIAADHEFVRELRKSGKPLLPVANKCEGRRVLDGLSEINALGLGEPIAVSAEHGEGMADLHRRISALGDIAAGNSENGQSEQTHSRADGQDGLDAADGENNIGEDADAPIRIAVVGRPNVGKSTLMNQLIGRDRLLTGPDPGVTRDSIRLPHRIGERDVLLIDTAGMRRRARVIDALERAAVGETRRAIRLCQVAVLVLDAGIGFDRQDLSIARHVAEEGRAMVIAVNKIDLAASRADTLTAIQERLEDSLPQMRGVTVVALSALSGQGTKGLMPAVFKAYETWGSRISTAKLNDWLNAQMIRQAPPLSGGRRVKLRYISQIKTRPPTFALFVNHPQGLPESYQRFLANGLREDFHLWGIPLRFRLKKGKNPYA